MDVLMEGRLSLKGIAREFLIKDKTLTQRMRSIVRAYEVRQAGRFNLAVRIVFLRGKELGLIGGL